MTPRLSKLLTRLAVATILVAPSVYALGDYAVTTGAGTTIFAFTCFVSKVCPATTPVDSAGGDMTDTTNHALKVVNPTAANFVATVQPGNTANTTPWLTSISQGGNTATVRGPSTGPAAATDSASVVTIRDQNSNGPAAGSASAPVVIATDQTGPCVNRIVINQTASTDILTTVAKANICSVVLVSATAQNISLVEGTGVTCATSIAGLIGGTTASVAVAANGGFSAVSSLPWLKSQTTADHICLLQSGAGNVSGVITYMDHS